MNISKLNLKPIIMHLALEINEELNSNAITNEMDALFDGGEWSGSEPDFSNIVTKWNLDRPTLSAYIDQAQEWSKTFEEKKPAAHKKWMGYGMNYSNPWEETAQLLHCIFMAEQHLIDQN